MQSEERLPLGIQLVNVQRPLRMDEGERGALAAGVSAPRRHDGELSRQSGLVGLAHAARRRQEALAITPPVAPIPAGSVVLRLDTNLVLATLPAILSLPRVGRLGL
jgi:hypothetical protein